MPVTYSNGTVTQSSPSDYAASQRSKERERESRYEQQRSNFFSGIFGGGQGSQPGGPDVRAPSGMTRPKMRPKTITVPSGGGGGDDNGGKRTIPFADYKPVTFQQAGLKIPKASELNYDNVPYYSGPNIRPKNMVFKDGVYVPDPTKKPGLADFLRGGKEMPRAMATDLRLGLGSLSGIDGFTDALEGLGFGRLRDPETGKPSSEAMQAYTNFTKASETTAGNAEAASMGDGDDNFYGNYDPCPEGYRTDPVTGMCVPVMGVAYETAPAAPAQYQGNFVDSPFPDLAGSGPASTPFAAPMNYTQAMNYTSPNIAPSSMAAQGMGIAGIPMTPILG